MPPPHRIQVQPLDLGRQGPRHGEVAQSEHAHRRRVVLHQVQDGGQAAERDLAAIEALDSAAGQDGPMADIALMKSAYLQANALSVEELETMLAPILNSDGMTLVFLAEELIASRAYQLGDLAEARRRFEMISFSLDASDGVKQRAQQALAALDTLAQLDGTNQTNGVTQ